MWKCPKCAEESEDTFDSCWNCQTERPGSPRVTATAANDDDPFEPATPDLPPSNLERRASLPPFGLIIAGALGALGGLCIILGVVQLNSAGSQFTRAIGGRDDTATTLIVIGFVLLLGGLLAFALRRTTSPTDSAQSDTPEQRLSRIEELRSKGLISKPEYQRLRSEILKQL